MHILKNHSVFDFQWEWTLEVKKDWPEESKAWSKFVGAVTTAKNRDNNKTSSASTNPTSKPKSTTKNQENSRLSKEQAKTLTHCYAYSSFLWIPFFLSSKKMCWKILPPPKKNIATQKVPFFPQKKKLVCVFAKSFCPPWFFVLKKICNVLVFSDTSSSNMLLSGIFA